MSNYINFANTYYATGGDVLDVGINDFSISFRISVASSPSGANYIISKGVYNTNGYNLYEDSGKILASIPNGSDRISINTASSIIDGSWHHIAATWDRDGLLTLYLDGGSPRTVNISSESARDLTSANSLAFGAYSPLPTSSGFYVDSGIYDVKIYIGGLWTPTQIAYQSANELDVSASAGTITEYWGCQEGSGTTITAGVTAPTNNLTLSNALAWASTTTIKKLGGVAQASIKKVGAVAVAEIKKIGGVA